MRDKKTTIASFKKKLSFWSFHIFCIVEKYQLILNQILGTLDFHAVNCKRCIASHIECEMGAFFCQFLKPITETKYYNLKLMMFM